MAPGIHPFVDRLALARREERTYGAGRLANDRPEAQIGLRILMASLPLVGLVLGVVGLALWTAH